MPEFHLAGTRRGSKPQPRVFERDDVVRLLRLEVERAGGQAAWAKETGTSRAVVNKVLSGQRQPTKKIIDALNLRVVFVHEGSSDFM